MALSLTAFIFILPLCIASFCFGVTGVTDSRDAAALKALKLDWQNSPPNWNGADPCGSWEGVLCSDSRVTSLSLSTMNLKGKLAGDIGFLTALKSLDLSYNKDLTGTIPSTIGELINLDTLIMIGCGFTGPIPNELGNLRNLTFLALNSNKLSGQIPSSLGNLAELYWLDIADNNIGGTLPVSTANAPGLDNLTKAKHLNASAPAYVSHFNKNQLKGSIPPEIFNANMQLIHVLFDSNSLTGGIPSTLDLVLTLEVVRLDRNLLEGPVPSISNLTNVSELHLSNNKLDGPLPDLSALQSLAYVDLSNNSFNSSKAPDWFTTIQTLTTLVMENGTLEDEIPSALFDLPQLQTVRLRHNLFNASLDMGNEISPQLQFVDLEFNKIPDAALGKSYTKTLLLLGNPVCESGSPLSPSKVCKPAPTDLSYATPLTKCEGTSCGSGDWKINPESCQCQVPFQGVLVFRAPLFSDLSNNSRFQSLESTLWTNLSLTPGSVYICCLRFDSNDYLNIQLQLFPQNGKYFNRTEIQRIGFALSKQTYKPPHEFGPFYFIANPYAFPDASTSSGLSSAVIIGIAIGAAVLCLAILGIGVYALKQKRRAEKALELSKPFASWGTSGPDSGGAPKLKGARWFSFQELKKSTNNFSDANEIGSGGYGKVYKGILPGGGEMLAIKRAQQGSMQGGAEFKNEIELLSRVHHKNLVGLIGFCFEQGEQMLVYEYMPNGTLRESLSGRTGIQLDWRRRVRIALGSAKGLSYLHELANPPIIHRDVKSSNILLDENLNAKVADFGLSKLVADGGIDAGGKGHVSTQVKGTLGYLDPEYYMTQQLSEKSDVYSFGVVLLEIITAKQPIERGKYIVREVRTALERGGMRALNELLDPLLRDSYSLTGLEGFVELALRCVEEAGADRPSMSEVVKELESIIVKDGPYNSSSSAASESGGMKGHHTHPYASDDGVFMKKGGSTNAFDYSGGYTVPPTVEPK
eukprot:Gb_02426 [translate_table: standard]